MLNMGNFMEEEKLILRLSSSVRALNLQLQAHSGKDILISLDGPTIDEIFIQVINLENKPKGRLAFSQLAVTTDEFKVQKVQGTKNLNNKISLPSNGIVYGNMDVPNELKIPKDFCCFGTIYLE